MTQHTGSGQVTIELYGSVERIRKTASGVFQGRSWSRVVRGSRTGTVDIQIDVDQLIAALGPRALRAKTGRTKACSGAIVVKVRRGSVTTSMIDPSAPTNEIFEDVVPDPPPRTGAIRIAGVFVDPE